LPGKELWVSDLTCVATWRGFVYVAFVIDGFARLKDGFNHLLIGMEKPMVRPFPVDKNTKG